MARGAAFSLDSLPTELVWKAGRHFRPAADGMPTGYPVLDAALPGGGWPRGSIIELLSDTPGIGEIELLLPVLKRVAEEQLIAWISPPCLPYAPALAARGLPLNRLLVVTPESRSATVWATRQALSSAACHAVLAWMDRVDMAALRRLQLAAEDSDTPLFLHRSRNAASQPSPACLRLELSAADGRLRIDILKRRGPAASAPVFVPLQHIQVASIHALDSTGHPGSVVTGFRARHR